MNPGDWVFAGESYKCKKEFPTGYWASLSEEWASDYVSIAKGRAAGEAAVKTALSNQLAPLRSLQLPVLVLGSKGDPVCSAAKMEAILAPAIGAEYLSLPFDGKHNFWDDNGNNGNVYDLAGPILKSWMAKKV